MKTRSYKEHLLEALQDPEEAAAYLDACFDDDNPEVFLLALKDIAEAKQKKKTDDTVGRLTLDLD